MRFSSERKHQEREEVDDEFQKRARQDSEKLWKEFRE